MTRILKLMLMLMLPSLWLAGVGQCVAVEAPPLMLFSPKDPLPRIRHGHTYVGSLDYMDLFKRDAAWSHASAHVGVFKFYPQFIDGASDADLQLAITDLTRRGITIGLETGALSKTAAYGSGVEGFGGPKGLQRAQRIKALGGNLRYVSLDEPYSFGCHYSGPHAARMTPTQAAQEVVAFITGLKAISPEVVVGDTEALSVGVSVAELEGWLDAYRLVNGAPFPFFTLDAVWTRSASYPAAHQLQDWVQAHGMQFAIIYDGVVEDTSDAAWLAHAEEAYCRYEQAGGRRPDQVVMQSWHSHPTYLLPETAPTRFTHLIDGYYRPISTLDLAVNSQPGDAACTITGRLSSGTSPIAGVPITVWRQFQQGPGEVGHYGVSGFVPNDVVKATVGVRLNHGAPLGPCDVEVLGMSMSMSMATPTQNLVPDGDFRAARSAWKIAGSGLARWETTPVGLQLQASADQTETVTSAAFPVQAKAGYQFAITARVAPAAADHGSFFLTFSFADGSEALRQELPFAAAEILIATATTGPDGTFSAQCAHPHGSCRIVARFAGDERWRPVGASRVVSVQPQH